MADVLDHPHKHRAPRHSERQPYRPGPNVRVMRRTQQGLRDFARRRMSITWNAGLPDEVDPDGAA